MNNFFLFLWTYDTVIDVRAGQKISSPLTLCGRETPQMGTLANPEDLDKMPHNAAFHQALHCLLRQNQSSVKENNIFWNL